MIYVEWCNANKSQAKAIAGTAWDYRLNCKIEPLFRKVCMLLEDREQLGQFLTYLPNSAQSPTVCFETNDYSVL